MAYMWNPGGAMVGGGNHIISQGACSPASFLTLLPCHVGRTDLVLKTMKEVGATAVHCTPSYATYIPEYAERLGFNLKSLNLKVIITAGEPGPASVPGLRAKLEEAWGPRLLTLTAPNRRSFLTNASSTQVFISSQISTYLRLSTREIDSPSHRGSMAQS